jgi:hypothetical protein
MLRDGAQVRSTLNHFGNFLPPPEFTCGGLRIASCSETVASFDFEDIECILEENILDFMSR